MDFLAEKSSQDTPMAVLKDGTEPIMRVYMTSDEKFIRIQLTELKAVGQLKINPATGVVEFRRKP